MAEIIVTDGLQIGITAVTNACSRIATTTARNSFEWAKNSIKNEPLLSLATVVITGSLILATTQVALSLMNLVTIGLFVVTVGVVIGISLHIVMMALNNYFCRHK